MAVIAPQTDVFLLKCPLEISDINQLTFANANAQYTYFSNLPKLEVHDFTYQRKDGTIRYGANFDDLLQYNYVMYRNDAYSNKWFYAFITDMEYLNDNVTAIKIKTDVWQCWQFSLNYKPVLVDREHVADDTRGKHTLPEDLELGDYVINGNTKDFHIITGYYTVVEVSQIENQGESATMTYQWSSGLHSERPRLNGIERGTIPLITSEWNDGGESWIRLHNLLDLYDKAGLGESVINVYTLPKALAPNLNMLTISVTVGGNTSSVEVGIPEASSGAYNLGTTNFNYPVSVNHYSPKNAKLFTYPYCYFTISNNCGSTLPYRYEDFSSANNFSFKTEGTFGASGNVRTYPQNYKGNPGSNYMDYSIAGGKYPICSWKSDSYTNWLTQNAVNLNTEWKTTIIGGFTGIGSGAIQGGMGAGIGGAGLGAAAGVVQMGGNMIALAREQHLRKTQANMVSDQVKGNLNAGDFVWAKFRTCFTYMAMSIKAEYARAIDEYFSQFGYKCNRVKIPNITGRRNWNYVKTVGCYIEGNIPQGDLQEIKRMFDNGITLWHNPATFADYSQNNDII